MENKNKLCILFISTSCSQKKYQEVYEMRNKKLIEPQQKFCNLLVNGMSMVDGVDVECITALPVSASTVSTKHFDEEYETVSDNLHYKYLSFTNGKLSRYTSLFGNCRRAVSKWIKETNGNQQIVVCDALSYFITRPAQIEAHKAKIPIVGIVTDLPLLTTNMKGRKESLIKKAGLSVFQYLTDRSLKDYDAYIPLTESINSYVNNSGKPYIIIEGSVDGNEINNTTSSIKSKVVLYAGGIYEKYGLKNLVEAFINAETNGYELHIYGEGSYVEDLKQISMKHPKVKYMGMATLEDIVVREKEAMLLVNPRPSNEEFSKYSFPSKTLEYMVSGTPLLTTRLPGIPSEYFDYLYSFEGDSIDLLKKDIEKVLKIDAITLDRVGQNAKNFVLVNKSNVMQGTKIVRFAECLIDK